MQKRMIQLFIFLAFFFLVTAPSHTQASGFGWGFKKNTEHKIPDVGEYKALLDKYNAYYADFSGDKDIYLTFDNGYEEGYTDEILDVLKKHEVPAAFFVTGHYVESNPELVAQMVEEGHIIGNHSYHHPDLTILTKEAMRKELETLEKAVEEVSDQEEIRYLRPPRGMFNEETLGWANELGLTHVFWSLAFIDWDTKGQKGSEYALDQILKQIHPGAIILLHAVSSDNAEALDKMIVELKRQGYTFKTLDDLIMKDQVPKELFSL